MEAPPSVEGIPSSTDAAAASSVQSSDSHDSGLGREGDENELRLDVTKSAVVAPSQSFDTAVSMQPLREIKPLNETKIARVDLSVNNDSLTAHRLSNTTQLNVTSSCSVVVTSHGLSASSKENNSIQTATNVNTYDIVMSMSTSIVPTVTADMLKARTGLDVLTSIALGCSRDDSRHSAVTSNLCADSSRQAMLTPLSVSSNVSSNSVTETFVPSRHYKKKYYSNDRTVPTPDGTVNTFLQPQHHSSKTGHAASNLAVSTDIMPNIAMDPQSTLFSQMQQSPRLHHITAYNSNLPVHHDAVSSRQIASDQNNAKQPVSSVRHQLPSTSRTFVSSSPNSVLFNYPMMSSGVQAINFGLSALGPHLRPQSFASHNNLQQQDSNSFHNHRIHGSSQIDRGLMSNLPQSDRGLMSNLPQSDRGLMSSLPQSDRGLMSNLSQSDRGLMSNLSQSDRGLMSNLSQSDRGLMSNLSQSDRGLMSNLSQSDRGLMSNGLSNMPFGQLPMFLPASDMNRPRPSGVMDNNIHLNLNASRMPVNMSVQLNAGNSHAIYQQQQLQQQQQLSHHIRASYPLVSPHAARSNRNQ